MSRWLQGIPSIAGSDLSSAPVTWMPFGKRLLTSAVEGEFKQSCVIFAFYFMSFAATVLDSCDCFVIFFMLCIILSIYMSIGILPLHMYLYFTFISLSS